MRTMTILLIEDNPQDVRLIRETLKDVSNFKSNLISVLTLKEGCEQIQKNNFDIILLDLNLPDSTGQQTFQKVIDCNNEIPVVLITGMEDEKLSLKLIMEGAQDYITKQSLNPDLLGKSILYSIERHALLRNIKIQNVQIDRIEKERILLAKFPSQNPAPILRVAGNGKLLYINEAGIKLLPDWQLIINEIIPSWLKDIINPIFIEGTNIKFELGHREHIYSFYAVPLIEEGYINLYGRDITEVKQTEKELRESESKFRILYESANDAFFLMDQDIFIDCNPKTLEMFGCTSEQIIGQPPHRFSPEVQPDGRKSMEKSLEKIEAALRGQPQFFEWKSSRYDGTLFDAEISLNAFSNMGKYHLLSVARDITERKRIELELKKSEEKYRSFISQISEGVYRYDCDQPMDLDLPIEEQIDFFYDHMFIAECNNSLLKMYRIDDQKDIIGKGPLYFHGGRHNLVNRGHVRKFFSNGYHIENGITEEFNTLGQLMYISNNALGIFENNQLVRVWGTQIDTTERKRAEQELILANKELVFQNEEKEKRAAELIIAKENAEQSDRLKSAFLANMSHEIRTPMNGILGFAELLKEPGLTGEEQQEYIRIIEKSGARMLNIIDDIVDISKIESGLMEVSIKESNINEQIEYIYTFFRPQVEKKGMQFFFKNTLPAKEATIRTDSVKVNSILTNLVKNAIKYSKEGAIEFGYIKKDETLEFYVKDTGDGIPKDSQSAIFERFIQADITDKMARQGAGLGLSISKAYVEMLGGTIWVESEEGIGSTFYFTIPYNVEPEEKNVVGNIVTAQNEKNPIKDLKILIVEDDETSEMLISIISKGFSKEVLKARTGKEAIEICRANPDLDLILMDIQIPDLNGHEATRQIRQFNKVIVIMAQTAFGLSGDREKAIEAGCNDYISKPILRDELLSLIQKYFKK